MNSELKYLPSIYKNLPNKSIIIYNGYRLKTNYIINIMDMFLCKYLHINKEKIIINSELLKYIYGSIYSKYIAYLIDINFIYLYKNYSTGNHGKIYKLTDEVKNDNIIFIKIDLPEKLKNKIKTKFELNTTNDIVKQKLINDLYKVKLDFVNAKKWTDNIKDKNKKTAILMSIKKINNKNIYYTFDKYGRLHTNYTNLKKHIRENYLSINNCKLKELDITNSQPFFLYLLMKQNGFTDFNNFDSDVLNGIIYDKIKESENISRKEAKINVYSVLFGRNMNKTKWDKMFYNKYPEVFNWIKNYKNKYNNYKIIAQKLQQMEADFIFNNVINKIILHNKNIPIITIHDAILVPEKYYETCKNIFINELNYIVK